MSKDLEQFIRDNRDQFDTEEPGDKIWKKLEEALTDKQNDKKQKSTGQKTIVLTILRWSAAAAILVLAGVGIFSLLNNHSGKDHDVTQRPSSPDTPAVNDPILKAINPAYAREVYQFTRLIELKQNELKEMEKENPNLYKKFVSDINKLDSSYNALKTELPENPNREQLLEAMIENLRLQTEVLNQQLGIINQIKASKSNTHDNNFKKI